MASMDRAVKIRTKFKNVAVFKTIFCTNTATMFAAEWTISWGTMVLTTFDITDRCTLNCMFNDEHGRFTKKWNGFKAEF